MEDEYDKLRDQEDQAMRLVHELSEELAEYEEETPEWYSVHAELNDAENELAYFQAVLEQY